MTFTAVFFDLESKLISEGCMAVCGVDEAGRGPLAGPVYAAAVVLKTDTVFEGLDDSKKLSEKKREKLFEEIKSQSIAYCISSVDEKIIDEINILNAAMLAMKKAIEGLGVPADAALVDGNCKPTVSIPCHAIIGGDAKIKSIAAASVLAKVSRDRFMLKMAEKYPQYCFEKHKGYGTKLHYAMLDEFSPCEIHRKTFLKKCFEAKKNG